MIKLYKTLLANDSLHATPAEVGTTFDPTPVTDNVTDVDLPPIFKIVSLILILC